MRKQALIPLAIGLVVGLAALKLGYDYVVRMQKRSPTSSGPVKKVVVASRALALGTKLTDKDLMVVDMPDMLVPTGAYGETKELLGQMIKISLPAKLPVLEEMVGPGKGFQGVIPEGYRAYTVKVDEFSGVAGLLKPGDRVDVVGTFNVRDGSRREEMSKIILQNVEVKAVGQNFNDADKSMSEKLSRSVTLLVRPYQVESLQLAASNGKLRLALRPPLDEKETATSGITLSKLLGGSDAVSGNETQNALLEKFMTLAYQKQSAAPAPEVQKESEPAQPLRPYEVELIVGPKVSKIYFEGPDSDRRIGPEIVVSNSARDTGSGVSKSSKAAPAAPAPKASTGLEVIPPTETDLDD